MANLDITYADLENTAKLLDTGRQSMLETLTQLKRAVADLTAKGFRTDKASGQYEISYAEFDSGVVQAVGGLEGMSQFLTSTAQTYADVDQQLATGISGS